MTRRAWSAALATALLTTFASLVGVQPASADTTTARSLLYKVAVAAEGGSSTYDRSYFKHWIDTNGDCQDTRAEVLIAESKVTPTYTTSNHCAVAKGKWYSYYDGTTWTNPSDVDIDHLVALKEAGSRVPAPGQAATAPVTPTTSGSGRPWWRSPTT